MQDREGRIMIVQTSKQSYKERERESVL